MRNMCTQHKIKKFLYVTFYTYICSYISLSLLLFFSFLFNNFLCVKKIIIFLYLKKPLYSSLSLVNDIQRVFIFSKSIGTPPQFLPRANRKMHLWRIRGDVNFYYAFFYAIRYKTLQKIYRNFCFSFTKLSSLFFKMKKITAGKSAGTCILNRILHRCHCESC